MSSDIYDDEKDVLLDHEYDGIRELGNPMPRWWVLGFWFTIVFGLAYLAHYHVLGTGPSDVEEYLAEMDAARAPTGGPEQPGTTEPAAPVQLVFLTDQASLDKGKTLYGGICFACHGANGEGLVGPNLTDAFAVAGCDIESMVTSIRKGFPEKGMPAFGGGGPMNDQQLVELASYLHSLQGSNPANAKPIDPARELPCP